MPIDAKVTPPEDLGRAFLRLDDEHQDRMLLQALDYLAERDPDALMAVLALSYHGQSLSDVAAEMGVGKSAVLKRRERGLERIRRTLAKALASGRVFDDRDAPIATEGPSPGPATTEDRDD
jgi:DNA-directed RNA polymerase specialized sigma24 family protein